MNLVLKVSGSLIESRALLSLLNTLSAIFDLTVICGGGDQANAKLCGMGRKPKFIAGVRVTESDEELAIVIQSHIDTAARLQKKCDENGIPAEVFPSLFFGNCNADALFQMCIESGSYDKFALVTLQERMPDKINLFSRYCADYPDLFHFIPLDP